MTREDVSMFMPNDKNVEELPEVTTGFTVDGKKIDVEDYDCYCMIDIRNRGPLFWIKVNTSGFPFDPWGLSSSKEYVPAMGKDQWKFHKVSEACFRNYLKFITTHNHIYFRTAHRGISYT